MKQADLLALQETLYSSRNPTRQWLHNSRREWISAAIRKHCTRDSRGLEIGPGSGIYIPVLKSVCREVYVADCERAYLSSIEKRYVGDSGVNIVVDDITQSQLPSNHFDLVLCTEVVEHIADSRRAFQQIARILKPGGILVLSTPQRYSLLEMTARLALSPWLIWLTRLVYREPVLEMGHINLMTVGTVRAQLSAANLRVIEEYRAGLYIPVVAEFLGNAGQRWASRLEPRVRESWFAPALWTQFYVITR